MDNTENNAFDSLTGGAPAEEPASEAAPETTPETPGDTTPEAPAEAPVPDGQPPKKKWTKKKIILTVLLSILGVLIALIVAAVIYVNAKLDRLNFIGDESAVPTGDTIFDVLETDEPDAEDETYDTVEFDPHFFDDVTTGEEGDDETDPSITTNPTRLDPESIVWPDIESLGDDGLINIMIVGQDNSSYKSRSRTDSMILLSINPNTGCMTMTSFLRDTYVSIPGGYKDNRLNVAYKLGGFKLMFETFKQNFGVNIDYGFAVNFDSFKKIVDILGGVSVELTQAEIDYLKGLPFDGLYDGIRLGPNDFTGEQAINYVRARHVKGTNSDWGRTSRQRKFITSVYKSLIGSSLSTINELFDEIFPLIGVYGLDKTGLVKLIGTLFPLLGNEIKSYAVPTSGYYKSVNVGGASVLMPDLVKIRSYLIKILPLSDTARAKAMEVEAKKSVETTVASVGTAAGETTSAGTDTSGEETTVIIGTTAEEESSAEASLTQETTAEETTEAAA